MLTFNPKLGIQIITFIIYSSCTDGKLLNVEELLRVILMQVSLVMNGDDSNLFFKFGSQIRTSVVCSDEKRKRDILIVPVSVFFCT